MKYKIISIVACFFLSVFICIIGYNVVSNQLFELKNTPNVIYINHTQDELSVFFFTLFVNF